MKFSEIITLSAALTTSASASPMKRSANVPDFADITFVAADNSFSQSFPTDGSVVDICKPTLFLLYIVTELMLTNLFSQRPECLFHLVQH